LDPTAIEELKHSEIEQWDGAIVRTIKKEDVTVGIYGGNQIAQGSVETEAGAVYHGTAYVMSMSGIEDIAWRM
jgi:hypothetical protein